jgi:hypothetical protein
MGALSDKEFKTAILRHSMNLEETEMLQYSNKEA